VQSLPSKHVLIVEDDETYRRMVERMLAAGGYRVTAAIDFASAMRVLESEETIDLLLADVRMPAGTPHGLSIGRIAQLRRGSLKVLYMTGAYDVRDFALFGQDARVLHKPFTAGELVAAIEAAIA